MRTTSALLTAVLGLSAVGLVLLLAACGGGGGKDSAEDQTTPTEQKTQAPAEQETQAPAPTEEPPDVAAGGDIDPCALVTKVEAEAILGASVGEPKPLVAPPVFDCTYDTSDFDRVGVSVVIFTSEDVAAGSFQSDIDTNGYQEVDGVGDRAYRSEPIFNITFQKGRYEASITVNAGLEDDEEFALAKDLAEKVLARLP